MSHWARAYIGKPHARDPDGDGPVRFSCWGMVRHVFSARHGIHLPRVAIVDHEAVGQERFENVAAIKRAARVSGMRPMPVGSAPLENDIVLMRNKVDLHCGVVIRANGRISVLHSAHETGVICQPWSEAVEGMTIELWRAS